MYRLLVAVAAICMTTSCAGQEREFSTSFREHGVDVTVDVVTTGGDVRIEAEFDPGEGWHLYSTELAMTGVEGIGRPTRLEVTSGAVMGPIRTSAAVSDLDVPALGITVPVFPDGPVVLTSEGEVADTALEVSVTYMACSSDGGCRIPVVDRRVVIALDDEQVEP